MNDRLYCSTCRQFVERSRCEECGPTAACGRVSARPSLGAPEAAPPELTAELSVLGREVLGRPEASPVSSASPVAGEVKVVAEPEKEEQPKPRRRTDPCPASTPVAAGSNDASDVTALAGDPVQPATPLPQVQIAAELGLTRDRVRTLLGEKRTRSQIPKEDPDAITDTAPETEQRAADPIDMVYEAVRCVYLARECIRNDPQRAREGLDRCGYAVEELERGIDALTDELRTATGEASDSRHGT